MAASQPRQATPQVVPERPRRSREQRRRERTARAEAARDRRARRPRRRRRRARCTARSSARLAGAPASGGLTVQTPRTRAEAVADDDDLHGQRRDPRDPGRGADRRAREPGAAGELVGGRGRGSWRAPATIRRTSVSASRESTSTRSSASSTRRRPGRRARRGPRAPSVRIASARRSSACRTVALDPRPLALGGRGGQRRPRGASARASPRPARRARTAGPSGRRPTTTRYWTVSPLATTSPGCSASASTGPSAHSRGRDERPAQRAGRSAPRSRARASMNDQAGPITSSAARCTAAIAASVGSEFGGRSPRSP